MKSAFINDDIHEIVENLGDVARAFSGKTIVITGGTGFLGRYFLETFARLSKDCLQEACRVIAYDSLITSQIDTLKDHPSVTFIKHDVIEPLKIDGPVDFILHAAGIASPFYYRANPLKTLDVGVTGTRNMLELAKEKGARLLFFSSSEIYGDPDAKHVPTLESYRGNVSCLGSRACYDESKRVGETLCRIFNEQFGTATNMVRPFNVYGPGMKEKDYRVLPNFASRIIGKRPLTVYGNGEQTRTFCYITDAIVGFLRVLVKGVPGEPYNIGNPKPEINMLNLAKTIEKVLGHPVPLDLIEYPDSYPGDEPMRRCPDISKAMLQLGYEPKVSLEEGLRRFFDWTKVNYVGEL